MIDSIDKLLIIKHLILESSAFGVAGVARFCAQRPCAMFQARYACGTVRARARGQFIVLGQWELLLALLLALIFQSLP